MKKLEQEFESEMSVELLEPKKYSVYLLNDDYTSMEFVVNVLMSIFRHSEPEAVDITMKIHKNGKGLCGIFTYDIAESKIAQVHTNAKNSGYPLKAIMEEE